MANSIQKTDSSDNLRYYKRWAEVPDNAKKLIAAGTLKGKTDINPMWRIKVLTEAFGACGFGWYTEILEHWTETAAGETCAWVRVRLFVRDPETGEWSKGIEGVGGNKQSGKGKGDGINEEVFKMAETDAISVCCKKLGIGANVYWEKDSTKYTQGVAAAPAPSAPSVQRAAAPAAPVPDDSLSLDDIISSIEHAKCREDVVKVYRAYRSVFGGNERFEQTVREVGKRFPASK